MDILLRKRDSIALTAMGLIASGYDLYDRQDPALAQLCQRVREAYAGHEELLRAFGAARTSENRVNPFWPRASALTIAAWFMDDATLTIDWAAYQTSQRRAGSLSATAQQAATAWLKTLPAHFPTLIDTASEHDLLRALRRLEDDRSQAWQTQLDACRSLLDTAIDIPLRSQQTVFSPNILQAPELTDIAYAGAAFAVIAAAPRRESILHEALHGIVSERLSKRHPDSLTDFTRQADHDKMLSMGYAWTDDKETPLRVAEESIVRVLTCLVLGQGRDDTLARLQWLRREGFHVPDALLDHRGPYPRRLSAALEAVGLG